MTTISASQFRSARAMLNLSREQLADMAKLSVQTVRNLEMGTASYRSIEDARRALEHVGVEFTEDDGVRRKSDEVRILRGVDSTDIFYEDMMQTLKAKGGDLAVLVDSQYLLAQSCGRTDRLKKLSDLADIKCLLIENVDMTFSIPQTKFKSISRVYAGVMRYYLYGDKVALISQRGGGVFHYVIYHDIEYAQSSFAHFENLWGIAATITQAKFQPCFVQA